MKDVKGICRLFHRWEWEKSGNISVCDLRRAKDNVRDTVTKTIAEMIKEFRLPLKVKGCTSEEEKEIRDIISKCPREGTIDDNKAVRLLNEVRKTSQRLMQAFVIIVDEKEYEPFYNWWDKYKGIYGVGDDSGLVFLRVTHKEAVRHEIGHMFGLEHHEKGSNPNCIMNWECPTTQFCNTCKSELEDIWEEELKGKL